MGYCNNEWISDYTYLGVLNWRAAESFSRPSQDVIEPGMLVWGRIEDGRAVLEPAVRVTRGRVCRRGRVLPAGRARENGSRLFGLDFVPMETADHSTG